MGDRCTGDCCRHFFLPFQPEEMAKKAAEVRLRREWKAKNPEAKYQDVPAQLRGSNVIDIEKIAAMAIYLGQTSHLGHPCPPERGAFYRCDHLRANGDCGSYSTRPSMCRSYPYGRPCVFPGCEHDGARAGEVGTYDRDRTAIIDRDEFTHEVTRVSLRVLRDIPLDYGPLLDAKVSGATLRPSEGTSGS